MKIWVNGTERADIARRAEPRDMLEAIDDEATQSGEILSELYVDGEMVSREYFCELALGEWETASFKLMPFMDFLRDTLSCAEAYAHKLENGIEAFARRLEIESGALSGDSTLANIIDGVNWLLGIYERAKIFTPVPLRLEDDAMIENKILISLSRLLDLQNINISGACDDMLISCLREELLPSVQMLECRVSDIAQAAQMPVQ